MQLSIAPQRWYAPADGVTRIEVIITLRSGEGNPVAGRGAPARNAGDDSRWRHYEWLRRGVVRIHSSNPGDAIMTASVEELLPCSNGFRSGTSTIHFTDFAAPDSAARRRRSLHGWCAPHCAATNCGRDGVQRGGATDESRRLSYSREWQLWHCAVGIGLAFPPVGDIENFAIPANSSRLARAVDAADFGSLLYSV